jgi:hypothetical protein
MTRKTLEACISYRINRMKSEVFVRDDFKDLGGYDQVGRILRKFVVGGRLVRLGYGIYARAKLSSITGKPMLATAGGFVGIVREALDRLNSLNKQFKGWEPSQSEQNYNAGRTTQVPANATFKIKGRLSRNLTYNGMRLLSEA